MNDTERREIARKRLIRVLGDHGIASARTLEQKISDAGPNPMRIDPHILTEERNALVKDGRLKKRTKHNAPWFHLAETPAETLERRLGEQALVFKGLQHGGTGKRIGQSLEIAIYRALLDQEALDHFGGFPDLGDHGDDRLYTKEEPPGAMSGRRLPGNQRLDFLVRHPVAGWAGIEAKNVREWLYPDRPEIKELLGKAVAFDCVPVLIARRIHYVTFRLFSACGVVVHQTYNQLLPEADRDLADRARHKKLLGYHDIRVGNQPDARLRKFIGGNLPKILPEAREKFDAYHYLLTETSH